MNSVPDTDKTERWLVWWSDDTLEPEWVEANDRKAAAGKAESEYPRRTIAAIVEEEIA